MVYPIEVAPDTNGTLLVSFPDLPWVVTYGEDEADALVQAADALATAVEFLMDNRQPVPTPSRVDRLGVVLSTLVSAKIALYNLMLEERVTVAGLSRRLHLHRPQVDRLLDTRHASRIDEVERAFGTFGRRLELTVRPEITGAARERPRRIVKRAAKRQ